METLCASYKRAAAFFNSRRDHLTPALQSPGHSCPRCEVARSRSRADYCYSCLSKKQRPYPLLLLLVSCNPTPLSQPERRVAVIGVGESMFVFLTVKNVASLDGVPVIGFLCFPCCPPIVVLNPFCFFLSLNLVWIGGQHAHK